jgi:hypothetical protein
LQSHRVHGLSRRVPHGKVLSCIECGLSKIAKHSHSKRSSESIDQNDRKNFISVNLFLLRASALKFINSSASLQNERIR